MMLDLCGHPYAWLFGLLAVGIICLVLGHFCDRAIEMESDDGESD